jgi:nitrite reductase/ring-hydroxylating ferredoxin subunit
MSTDDPEQVTVAPDGRPFEEQPVWRQEFPIDGPQSEYVSRREFTRLLLVTSLAFVVGQTYIVVSSLLRQRKSALPVAEIAATGELPINGVKLFTYPAAKDPCVLIHLSTGEYVAYGQKCTHLSCPVIPQPEKGVLQCPCHEGKFNVTTGSVISGPPNRPLPRITLEVRDSSIYATGVEGGLL